MKTFKQFFSEANIVTGVDGVYFLRDGDGKLHRNFIMLNEPNTIVWTNNEGVIDRKDNPAIIKYFWDGKTRMQGWYKDGKRHREGDLPAYITYNEDGTVHDRIWCLDGKETRVGKPANIMYYHSGKVAAEVYETDDRISRVGGPAVIHYKEDGTIKATRYYLHGNLMDKEEYDKHFEGVDPEHHNDFNDMNSGFN